MPLRLALTVPQYLQAHGYAPTATQLYLGQPSTQTLEREMQAAWLLGQATFEAAQLLRQINQHSQWEYTFQIRPATTDAAATLLLVEALGGLV